MFDRLASNLLQGRPRTSTYYRDDSNQPAQTHRANTGVRSVKVRNIVTGAITHHPSIRDAVKHYPGAYAQLIDALIKNQGRVWNNIQVKDASDETAWPDAKTPAKHKAGNKFVLFLLEHKETKELKIETRIDAAKVLGVNPATINSMGLGIAPDRPSYQWTVRYARKDDLARVPAFNFDPRAMIFHKSVR